MQSLSIVWDYIISPFQRSTRMLNTTRTADVSAELDGNNAKIVEHVSELTEKIVAKYVVAPNLVDYVALTNSNELQEWRQFVATLNTVDMSSLTHDQSLSLFINLYNLATIDAICTKGGAEVSSVLTIPKFWGKFGYRVAQNDFTLDGMEHGVLRGNKPHPSSSKSSYFKAHDVRSTAAIKQFDHRIHFALVCGAKSCPPLRCVRHDHVDEDLQALATEFIQDRIIFNISDDKCRVEMSMILKWYMIDFGADAFETLDAIKPYMNEMQLACMEEMDRSKTKISFTKYQWGLNNTQN
eukprot:m.105767 g.105767  ORF g.105767 m.105767 type:complete len:296 (-) comp9138_c1_seq1:140-1027(-)